MSDLARPAVPGPQEIFDRFRANVLAGGVGLTEDLCAADIVVELPLAPPGAPRRFDGRAAFIAFSIATREALPVRFEGFDVLAVHRTADPEVIVAEYEVTGVLTTTGRRSSAAALVVLRARDGRVVHWREYQNVSAVLESLGHRSA
ncbi:nuclear transport factor 2 family protein [Kitasatospora sp. NPDC056327]|uniref:nuclear transport factor 2 family protein n=1 Tax=Kitasatospora sp. NPDC056327 TaxID=3345785 RepID=UPI0035DAE79E